MPQTAVYVRVSSPSQDMRSQSAELKRWADGQSEPVRWYRDKLSGTTMDRPGWNKLWADILAGRVSRVCVWRLDRLGRTAAGLTQLFADLQARGIGLLSLRESLDLSTPAGRMLCNMLSGVAQFETEVRRERQQAGIAAARAAGKRWGGSTKGRLLHVTKEQLKMVKRLHRDQTPIAVVARTVGLSRPTIYRLLERE